MTVVLTIQLAIVGQAGMVGYNFALMSGWLPVLPLLLPVLLQ
jgi:hypothetical protein